jgi:hypothetical protein
MGAISTHTRTDWAASVESRWWYGVAALPVVSVGSLLAVGLATGLVVISGALGGAVTGPVFGLLVLLGVVAAAAVIAAGVLLPVSLYFDSGRFPGPASTGTPIPGGTPSWGCSTRSFTRSGSPWRVITSTGDTGVSARPEFGISK